MIPMALFDEEKRNSGSRRTLVLLTVVAAACVAAGCASTRATAKHYGRDSALRLDDPAAWARYEVRRTSFTKRLAWDDLTSGTRWETRYKGTPVSWITPINVIVPPKVYEERAHRGRFRFEHPLSHQRVVLRAHARSRSVGTVPLPLGSGAPAIDVYDGSEERLQGTLRYDLHSPIVFAGELGGRQVEIEQQDEGARRPHHPLAQVVEQVFTPFPVAGEFVVRLDGSEAARFLKRRPRGTVSSYELALRQELPAAQREDAALAFTVFALMEEFVHSAAG